MTLFLFAVLTLALQPATAWYEKSDDYTPQIEIIDLSQLKASDFNVSEQLVRVVLLEGWQIQRRSETQILAKFNEQCLMRIDLDVAQIRLQEVVTSCDFKRAWLSTIRKSFIRNSTYHRHVEIARDYLGEY
ncbi:MAG: hypothetical protein L3J89_00440 [Gammaproteobacteria bacterium]|nr:hypothetical protein [Gammaproteobacteria bacterium]